MGKPPHNSEIPHLYKRNNNGTHLLLYLCKVPGPKVSVQLPPCPHPPTLYHDAIHQHAHRHAGGLKLGTTSSSLNRKELEWEIVCSSLKGEQPSASSWSDSLHLFICDVPDLQGKVHFKDHFVRAAGKTSKHFVVKSILLMVSPDAISKASELGRREVGWATRHFWVPTL